MIKKIIYTVIIFPSFLFAQKGGGTIEVGGGGTGTVTSVGLTMPGTLFNTSVSGSPVSTTGTLAPTLDTQTANTVLAGPTTGGAATPTFRALVAADIPDVGATYWKIGGNTLGAEADFGSNDAGVNIEAGGTRRLRLFSGGGLYSGTLPDVDLTASDSARVYGLGLSIFGHSSSNTFLNGAGFVAAIQGNAAMTSLGNFSIAGNQQTTVTAADSITVGTGTHRWILNETGDVVQLYTNSTLAETINASQEFGFGTTPLSGVRATYAGMIRANGKILSAGTGDTPGSTASQVGFLNTNGTSTADLILKDDGNLNLVTNTGKTAQFTDANGYIPVVLKGSATLNFGNLTTLTSEDLTISVTGAVDGDVVSIGVPAGSSDAGLLFFGFVSAADIVTIRCVNSTAGSVDPASGTFKVQVSK